MQFFSQPWIHRWRDEINRDPEYASLGRSWTGPVLLRSRDAQGGVRTAYLDLAGGVCREARVGTVEDESGARIVIGADHADWERVLSGEVDPVLGLLRGVLALEKGTVLSMVPHQASARALLRAAVRVESEAGRDETAGPGPSRKELHQPVHPGPRVFQTLSDRGLDHDSFPMALYHKAKKLGIWDPRDIDLSQDRRDWVALAPQEQDLLLRLSTFFQAGEEAVARDLLPLIQVISREGRLEEEMYLATFLFEEAKHVEVFRRFLDEVAPEHGNLRRFESSSYRIVFEDELPTALFALIGDASPRAQVRAAVTYNIIVEGVLAETGYRGYQQVLHSRGILPGMQEAVRLLKRDESRHIAYGLYLISRLVAEHGGTLWNAVEQDLSRLLNPALGVVEEIFEPYEAIPFGLHPDDFTSYAVQQFQARLRRLDTARRSGRLVEEPV
ncbi:MAG TPA: R2-like ligand-binding oxidase [Longimicrobiales bacterium]|nr:R2-like ligand-binding oxidase [Longimicrobiales bacterium]